MLRRLTKKPARGLTLGRGTVALGGLAVAGTIATVVVEWARVWRHGAAPRPHDAEHLLEAGREATRETVEVIRQGYRAGERENTLFNMLAAFVATFGLTRAVTALIRSGRGGLLLGNVVVGDRHIHHFVPGIVIAGVAGATSIVVSRQSLDRRLAVPFGAGVALVLDEAALLLELEDVYWSQEGVLSVQLSFAAIALLAALAVAVRLLRRGEATVWHEALEQDAGARALRG